MLDELPLGAAIEVWKTYFNLFVLKKIPFAYLIRLNRRLLKICRDDELRIFDYDHDRQLLVQDAFMHLDYVSEQHFYITANDEICQLYKQGSTLSSKWMSSTSTLVHSHCPCNRLHNIQHYLMAVHN